MKVLLEVLYFLGPLSRIHCSPAESQHGLAKISSSVIQKKITNMNMAARSSAGQLGLNNKKYISVFISSIVISLVVKAVPNLGRPFKILNKAK